MLIGGGDIGRADTKYETGTIDEEVVKMAKKEEPNFLFISLASSAACIRFVSFLKASSVEG